MIVAHDSLVWTALPVGPAAPPLAAALAESAARHKHVCPRQVLGARMGLLGARLLDIAVPDAGRRLLAFVETDGCAADGVAAATGCTVGHRTLRVVDYGKVAATLVDARAGRAVRLVPRRESRVLARRVAPQARSRWHAQLEAYQVMPDEDLLGVQWVELTTSLNRLLSKPGVRAVCQACGEEIINERQVARDGDILCRFCAGDGYYRSIE